LNSSVQKQEKYFFEDKEKQAELKKILDSWIGTPFRHFSGVKGCGCDCIHFIASVFEEVGVQPEGFYIQRYTKDWHLHNSKELLLEGIKAQLRVKHVGLFPPMNGDVYLFQFGKVISHAAIFCDGSLYQSLTDIGVQKLPFFDRNWDKRKKYNFRVLK